MTSSPAGIGGMTRKVSEGRPSHAPTEVLGAVEELIIGVVAGILSKGITLPISAVCVRQQLGSARSRKASSREDDVVSDDNDGDEDEDDNGVPPPKGRISRPLSLLETLKALHKESGGIIGLYSALPPSIPLSLLPSLTLYIHTILLRLLPQKHQAHPPGILTFLLGAISSSLATLPLYPLVLVKSVNQAGGFQKLYGKGKGTGRSVGSGTTGGGGRRKMGMLGMLKRIIQVDGYGGLYKGVEGQLLKGLVQQGVMMLVKQR